MTKSGKVKKPEASTVVEWVSKACMMVDEELIKKSFRICHAINVDIDSENDDPLVHK